MAFRLNTVQRNLAHPINHAFGSVRHRLVSFRQEFRQVRKVLHWMLRTVSGPSLKPTIDCFAVDHALHAVFGKVGAKHGISRHGMSRPELVHS